MERCSSAKSYSYARILWFYTTYTNMFRNRAAFQTKVKEDRPKNVSLGIKMEIKSGLTAVILKNVHKSGSLCYNLSFGLEMKK